MIKLPDPSSVGDDTLLRLGVAAALEFPDGSMGASGLRREALHGRLKSGGSPERITRQSKP